MKRRKEIPEAIGEAVEPGGRAPAPRPLRVVQQFVNTHNHEFETSRDRLRDRILARDWLVQHGLLKTGGAVSESDRRRLLALRDALRAAIERGAGTIGGLPAGPVLEEASELARLAIRFDDWRPRLTPRASGVRGAMGRLLAIVYDAGVDGTLARLKTCRQCRWLFFDRSKNGSAQWCSMSICGNRAKNRSYRQRVSAKRRTTKS